MPPVWRIQESLGPSCHQQMQDWRCWCRDCRVKAILERSDETPAPEHPPVHRRMTSGCATHLGEIIRRTSGAARWGGSRRDWYLDEVQNRVSALSRRRFHIGAGTMGRFIFLRINCVSSFFCETHCRAHFSEGRMNSDTNFPRLYSKLPRAADYAVPMPFARPSPPFWMGWDRPRVAGVKSPGPAVRASRGRGGSHQGRCLQERSLTPLGMPDPIGHLTPLGIRKKGRTSAGPALRSGAFP